MRQWLFVLFLLCVSGLLAVDALPAPLPADLVPVVEAAYAPLDALAAGSAEAQAAQRQAVETLGLPLEVKSAKTGIVFRLVPAGSFIMGSSADEAGREADEVQHPVTLSKPFYVGKFEVTQGQWEAAMGKNPSFFQNAGKEAPVEQVSWKDCQKFLAKLCQMEGVPEGTYRLLTEAEWEYACRAGTSTALYTGGLTIKGPYHGPELDPLGWYGGNSGVTYEGGFDSSRWPGKQVNHDRAGTHPVGGKLPNAFGLYDTVGSVYEWCGDWDGEYPAGAVTDPAGPESGTHRVLRGGSWRDGAMYCRPANRIKMVPSDRGSYWGCRIVRTAP